MFINATSKRSAIKQRVVFCCCAMLIVFLISCGNGNDRETFAMQKEVENIRKEIAKYQRSEVWTGGNELSGCYMWIHRRKFLANDGLTKIKNKAKSNQEIYEGSDSAQIYSRTEPTTASLEMETTD